MNDLDLLRAGLRACVIDVERTTGIRLALTPWDDPVEGVAALVHTDTERPTHAGWEAVGLLRSRAGLALHPPRPTPTHRASPYGDLSALEAAGDVADVAQQVTQMALWERGSDPTWPPCPAHDGAHPVWPRLDVPPGSGDGCPDPPGRFGPLDLPLRRRLAPGGRARPLTWSGHSDAARDHRVAAVGS